ATWSVYARQLKALGRLTEARDAFLAALKNVPIGEHPEFRLQAAFDLGTIREQLREDAQALEAFEEVIRILDNPELLVETRGFDEDLLHRQAANVYERMIRICINRKEYDRALALFEKARGKYTAETKRLNYMVAKIHFERGAPTKALTLLE